MCLNASIVPSFLWLPMRVFHTSNGIREGRRFHALNERADEQIHGRHDVWKTRDTGGRRASGRDETCATVVSALGRVESGA